MNGVLTNKQLIAGTHQRILDAAPAACRPLKARCAADDRQGRNASITPRIRPSFLPIAHCVVVVGTGDNQTFALGNPTLQSPARLSPSRRNVPHRSPAPS